MSCVVRKTLAPRSRSSSIILRIFSDGRRVEPGTRLVEEQYLWLVKDGPGHHQALLHALGIRLHPVLAPLLQPHPGQQLVSLEIPYPEQPREELEVFPGRHLLVKVGSLETHPDVGLYPVCVPGDIHAQQGGLASLRLHLPGQHLEGGCLARPVRVPGKLQFPSHPR
jgi:hypothetical protein